MWITLWIWWIFRGFLKKTDSGIYGDVVWISEKGWGKMKKVLGQSMEYPDKIGVKTGVIDIQSAIPLTKGACGMGISVCAHLTQTRNALEKYAEMGNKMCRQEIQGRREKEYVGK